LGDLKNLKFTLKKNGEIVQSRNSADMIYDFDSIIEYVSKFMTLKIGDFIFTSTPSGVCPVKIGNELEGFLGEKSMFRVKIK
jgi:acylpyruvate hydrolase